MQEELSDNSKAILSSLEWDVLDFEDIEKSLAVRLTDDDLHAVLKCINAHDVLKKLKLTGCINITGCSLEPLRSSTVIQLIDLSLAKQFESPRSVVESKISQEVVTPILDSIVSANGSSLKTSCFHTVGMVVYAVLFTDAILTIYKTVDVVHIVMNN